MQFLRSSFLAVRVAWPRPPADRTCGGECFRVCALTFAQVQHSNVALVLLTMYLHSSNCVAGPGWCSALVMCGCSLGSQMGSSLAIAPTQGTCTLFVIVVYLT